MAKKKPWPKDAAGVAIRVAEERLTYLPSPRALHLWRNTANFHLISVLVDAKLAKTPIDVVLPMTMELKEEQWDIMFRRTKGVWYPEWCATKLNLPSWDRVEELNMEMLDRSVDPNDEDDIQEVQRDRARDEIYEQWSDGVTSAFAHAVSSIGLNTERQRPSVDIFLVPEGSAETKTWKDVADLMEKHGTFPERGTETPTEYVRFYADAHFPSFSPREIRNLYDQCF